MGRNHQPYLIRFSQKLPNYHCIEDDFLEKNGFLFRKKKKKEKLTLKSNDSVINYPIKKIRLLKKIWSQLNRILLQLTYFFNFIK